MRFRRKGTNWEGRTWATTTALNSLLDEIETWQPEPRSLDGTVSSAGHDIANPASDHRPTPYFGFGFVRAVDVGEEGPEGDELAEGLRTSEDPRLKYVIHKRRIFSSYSTSTRKAWEWGPYSGYNAHLDHVHVSLNTDDNNDDPWSLDSMFTKFVLDLQKDLNTLGFTDRDGDPVAEDGQWGPKTRQAHRRMMRAAARVKDARPVEISVLAPDTDD